MRPQSIIRFEQLYLGSLALGILNYFLSYDSMIEQLEADPAIAQMGFASLGFVLGTAVFSYAISLILWYFIARRANNVLRWVLLILTVFGLISLPTSLGTLPVVSMVLTLILTAMQLVALFFLWRPDANEWFANKGSVEIDPSTFE